MLSTRSPPVPSEQKSLLQCNLLLSWVQDCALTKSSSLLSKQKESLQCNLLLSWVQDCAFNKIFLLFWVNKRNPFSEVFSSPGYKTVLSTRSSLLLGKRKKSFLVKSSPLLGTFFSFPLFLESFHTFLS